MEDFENSFRSVSIYVDKDRNLIGIPCGLSEKFGVADIDTVLRLKAPYEDTRIESFIEEVLDACYTKRHNDESDYSTIEKFTRKKGFANAARDYTLITVVKEKDGGYSIMPTFNDYERGPIVIDDDEVLLPENYAKGELAGIMLNMFRIYCGANEEALKME